MHLNCKHDAGGDILILRHAYYNVTVVLEHVE